MEIVELFPGCFVPFDLYCRVRALVVLLLACGGLYLADRSLGLGRVDLLAALPAELVDTQPVAVPDDARNVSPDPALQLTYLERFFRGRTQAPDLVRYAATVAPASVRITRLTVIGEDTITGHSRTGPTLRVEGRAPDPDRLRSFVESLRVMAPAVSTERVAQTGSDVEGGFAFNISTDADQRHGAGPRE